MRYDSTKHIFAYWRRLRAGKPAPERESVDPTAFGSYLPDIFILEREDQGDWRFRLAGSSLCMLFGSELRGRALLAATTQASAEDAREMLAIASDDLLPVVAGASAILPERRAVEAELLLLPLLHQGLSGRRMLGALAWRGHDRHSLGACAGLEILSFRVIGERDTRFLQPPVTPVFLEGNRGERRGHLLVFEGGQASA